MSGAVRTSRTLFEKIWAEHAVKERDDGYTLLYVDRHYLGDDLPRETFDLLERKRLGVRRPEKTYAMADHYASTRGRSVADVVDITRRELVEKLYRFTNTHSIPLFALDDPRHGIVHVTAPEQGLTLPGMTVVCGDSHTSTHGALGALAFGIGSSEVSHVLATQTVWQKRPLTMLVHLDGTLGTGVTAKDLVLALIAQIGVTAGTGCAIEYAGSAIDALSAEARMTLCNMTIEAGARVGMIAPDEITFAYLKGRPYAPSGDVWSDSVAKWRMLASDPGARYSRNVSLDASRVAPMVTWGTNPGQACAIDERAPNPGGSDDAQMDARQAAALEYMGIFPGQAIAGLKVDRVFIGSCTNGRIEDLRLAARVVKGRMVKVPTLVVPGSRTVQQMAVEEGLDRIFIEAGAYWGEPGCSMCLAINGDEAHPGERVASTTNRNFVGRQGRGVRTHLMNPGMAAAAAVTGRISDYRECLQ